MYTSSSNQRKVKNFLEDHGMNVYIVCLAVEIVVYIFYVVAYFLEQDVMFDGNKDVELKTIILTILLFISCHSIFIAITRDNVYSLFQFLVLQSMFNICIYLKYVSIVQQGNEKYNDPKMLKIIKVIGLIGIILALICQINFYLFSYSVYKKNQFKIFKRVGAIPTTLRGYMLYKSCKNLGITFMELFIVNQVTYFFYQDTPFMITLDALLPLFLFFVLRLYLQAVKQEHKYNLIICLVLMLMCQLYKVAKNINFLVTYDWHNESYSFEGSKPEIIFNSTVSLSIIIVEYIKVLNTGLKQVFNPVLTEKEKQLNQPMII